MKRPAMQLPPPWELHANIRVSESDVRLKEAQRALLEKWKAEAEDLPTRSTPMPFTLSRVIGAALLLAGLALGVVLTIATVLAALLPGSS